MRSSFYGLEIGKSALTLSQLGLDVTGHNIANVDTKGYTRQRIISTAYDPFSTIGRALPVAQALIGAGVKVLIHDQIRSAYLDSRYRTQNSLTAYWQKRTEGLSYLESFFDNINEETSINFSVARFFEAVKIVAEDPVERAQRKLLQTAGLDLVQQLNTIYEGLIDLQESQNLAVKLTIEEINRIAGEVVELNKAIYGFEVTGQTALDLRDKRNVLLDDLSAIIPIEYREYPDGKGQSVLEVKIGGEILIDHAKQRELDIRETPNVIPGEAPVWEPIWKPKQVPVDGSECDVFLYMGSKIVPLTLDFATLGVDPSDPEQVSALVKEINAIATQFRKLDVHYVSADAYNDDPSLYPHYPFSGPDALAARMLIFGLNGPTRSLTELLGPNANFAIDCDEGGDHAFISLDGDLNGLIFARSKGCVISDERTYRVGYSMPETQDGPVTTLLVTGGELKAYMDMRDSLDVHTPGIPYYIEMLNNLARAFVQEINRVHREGYTEDIFRPDFLGLPDGSIQGVDFFGAKDENGNYIAFSLNDFLADPDFQAAVNELDTVLLPDIINRILNDPGDPYWADLPPLDPADPDYAAQLVLAVREIEFNKLYNESLSQSIMLVTAKNICLSQAVQNSENNIACSTSLIVKHGTPEELQRGNNENMNLLYKLFEKNDIALMSGTNIGSLDGYATSIRFDVGNTLSFAKKTADNYTVLTLAAENQRLAVAGVSLDEEMTELIKYQHSYNGAARVITAMDEMLDKLINGTGRVGL